MSAHRQPGSSIKPLSVYCPALESGYMPFYVQDDAPISYKAGGEVWSPKNFDGKFRGPITMRTGVQHSINTYSVQMLDKIGVRKSFDFARSLGLSVTDSPGKNDLALSPLSLGGLTYGVTPVEMAGAYSAIANGGVYIKPHLIKRIVDADGAEIYSYQPHYKRVMKEQTAWLMTDLLKSVVSGGTGTAAAVPGVITAGKTGTTEKNQDAWFCGFTPGYTMTVWIGYDEKVVMRDQYGGGCPARIFRSVMSKMHEKYHPKAKGMPSGIIKVTVCSKSGKLPSEFCDQDKLVTDYCTKEAAPKETCDACQTIYICPESGKLAGKYCPNPVPFSPNLDETGKATNTAPTEQCDIHTQPQLFKSYNNTYDPKKGGEVYICTDPRHEGRVYRANIPGALQSGGCPDQYIQKVQLPPGEAIELCPLPDHQLKTKKPKEVLQEILDH
ncbi:transglycosylase domain-containing protein [Syntrophomonas palmitatica]|uniref:transglycosylase domain-containing protein n=1 Tax=Syntrophomonas palmitatica TaxID=402877 RepID=UPI000ACA97B5|nr:penicillin-binding transpeptidase domain-containing protein [Syntrophomonas palmitatica]